MAFHTGAEADYRYAHALYNMAEQIRTRQPRVAIQLEKAADALLLTAYRAEGIAEADVGDWQAPDDRHLTRRLSATFHVPARRPSPLLPRP